MNGHTFGSGCEDLRSRFVRVIEQYMRTASMWCAMLCFADEVGHGETRTFTEEQLRKRLEVSASCRLF